MAIVPVQDVGFQAEIFTRFPLPRRNVGNEYTRNVQKLSCTYYSPLGLIYTPVQRRMLEIITTKAVMENNDGRIEFGGVSQVCKYYGMDNCGKYIKPMKEAIAKIATMTVYLYEDLDSEKYIGMKGRNLTISNEFKTLWSNGRSDLVVPELLDSQNYMLLTDDFIGMAKTAIPHNQADFMQIQSALGQDIYQWLCAKLPNLRTADELIRWSWLYHQYGESNMSPLKMKKFRALFKETTANIVVNFYQSAGLEFTDEGLILRKSPPVIDRDNKKAGFSLFY